MHPRGAILLAPVALAAPYWPPSAPYPPSHTSSPFWPHPGQGGPGSAIYFLDNNPSGNSIVSLHVSANGQLNNPQKISTGGVGSIMVNGSGDAVTQDSLGSQGSVTVVDDLLFTVNAGSNTVSLFRIDPRNPWQPQLVGSPADTLGEFPVSVDYSAALKKACVLNGGAKAGVTCFSVDPTHGLTVDGSLRVLDQAIFNETTPPSGPPGAASQILFNPDSSAVFVTVRGYPMSTPVKLGSFAVWPVEGSSISNSAPIVTQISDIVLNFGFLFLSETEIFLSDPSFGTALLTVESDWHLTEKVHTPIHGEAAICWTVYDAKLDTAYAIDAGVDSIYTVDPQTGAQTGSIPVDIHGGNKTEGVFDSVIQGDVLYALAATDGLIAVNLTDAKQIQYLDLSTFGNRQNYQGIAAWP